MKKHTRTNTPQNIITCAVRFLCAALAYELLFFGTCRLLAGEIAEWTVPASALSAQALLLLTIFLFEALASVRGKLRRRGLFALFLCYPAAAAMYAGHHWEALAESGKVLCREYLLRWNEQYQTNLTAFPDASGESAYALLCIVLSVFLLCLLLRYGTGVRLFLVLPPLVVLFLGLLVDAQPQWDGLAVVFVGVLLLYALPCDMQRMDWRGKRKNIAFPMLGAFTAATAAAVLLAALAGGLFAGAATRLQEKAPLFYAFQKQLEDTLKSIGTMGISFDKNSAHVDNSTPEYTGAEIVEITMTDQPQSNLYLKDFYSSVYANNSWKRSDSAYEKAAARAGYDSDELGTALLQEFWEAAATDSSILADSEKTTYTLTYQQWSGSALLPYFCDISQTDDVWVDGDGVLRKKRGTTTLSVTGRNGNALDDLADQLSYAEQTTENEALLDWYAEFARTQYGTASAELPAVTERVQEILENCTSEYYDIRNVGVYEPLAELVRNNLWSDTSYNLYLDELPSGTDTVEYFLETGHEGYCMHYASAATLMLQALGVPARYAAGYVVKPSMFSSDGGIYTATVTDRCAHAWVEIYMENIGWVPFEVTPGYSTDSGTLPTDESMQESLQEKHAQKQETEAQQETGTTETQEEQETTASETQETQQTEAQQATEDTGSRWFGGSRQTTSEASGSSGTPTAALTAARTILLVLLAAVLAAFLVRKLFAAYRLRLLDELTRRQNRRAVRRMSRRLYRRLGLSAFGVRTDRQFLEKLCASCPAVSPEEWNEYLRIAQKSAFSLEKITQEEARFCYRCYCRARKKS